MAKTTRPLFEEAYEWAIFQRLKLGERRDSIIKETKIKNFELREVDKEIELLDDVLEQLIELRDGGGIEEA